MSQHESAYCFVDFSLFEQVLLLSSGQIALLRIADKFSPIVWKVVWFGANCTLPWCDYLESLDLTQHQFWQINDDCETSSNAVVL